MILKVASLKWAITPQLSKKLAYYSIQSKHQNVATTVYLYTHHICLNMYCTNYPLSEAHPTNHLAVFGIKLECRFNY